MIPTGTILHPTNPSLLDATGNHPEGYNRRFAVLDDSIDRLYGDKIRNYFTLNGIDLTTCVLSGGEPDKRPAVSTTFLFAFSELHRLRLMCADSKIIIVGIFYRPLTSCWTTFVPTN